LRPYTGRFLRHGIDTQVTQKNGELVATLTSSGPLSDPKAPPQELIMQPIDAELFYVPAMGALASFIDFDSNGKPHGLYVGSRVAMRVAGAPSRKKAAQKKPATKTKRR
jgi:hypothetical protein